MLIDTRIPITTINPLIRFLPLLLNIFIYRECRMIKGNVQGWVDVTL